MSQLRLYPHAVGKALHNGKAHTAALLPACGEHGLAGFVDILDAAAPIPHADLQGVLLQNTHLHHNLSQCIGIAMDDGIGHRLTNGSLDIANFIEGRIKLRCKSRHRSTSKALIAAAA